MKVAIIGAGGHARVVYEILSDYRIVESYSHSFQVVCFVDNVVPTKEEYIMGIPVVGDHTIIPELIKKGVSYAIIAVGDNQIRKAHFEKLQDMGMKMINAIHLNAYVAPSATIGCGVVLAVGSIIGTQTKIGNNVIINTRTIVDHQSEIEDHVHISVGCAIAGRVTVKRGTFIGIGSVTKEYITIGENVIIGAGSVVLKDIPDNVVVVGAPARVIKRR